MLGTRVANPSVKDHFLAPVWSEILRKKNAEEGTLYRAELLGSVTKKKKGKRALGLCLQLVCKYCDLFNP